MQELNRIVNEIQNSENYSENALILNVLITAYKSEKKVMTEEHRSAITPFIESEAKKLVAVIPLADSYRRKDEMFAYAGKLAEFYMLACAGKPDGNAKRAVTSLFSVIREEQVAERTAETLLDNETAGAEDVKKAVGVIGKITDEYQRGAFYNCLLQNAKKLSAFSAEGKGELAGFVARELERYAGKEQLSADEAGTLELIADVSKYFIDENITSLLQKLLNKENNGVRFFAVETLISCNKPVPAEAVGAVAHDLRYAYMLFCMLAEYKRTELFPKELATAEYIAKSDMVQWLAYPTELGCAPDEIELLGCADIKKELFYVFKFKSASANLTEDLQNEWLIGWSSSEGGTFSEFDRLRDYEKDTPAKTVKNIAKKLLR